MNSLEKYAAKQSLKELLSQAIYGAKPNILGGVGRGAGIGAGIGGLGGIAAMLTPAARSAGRAGKVMPLREMVPKGLGGEPSFSGLLQLLSAGAAGTGGAAIGGSIGGAAGLMRSLRARKGWITRRKRINRMLAGGAGGAGLVGLGSLINRG